MKDITFDTIEVMLIHNMARMIVKFFPECTDIHHHATIILKKIEAAGYAA